MGHRSGSRIPLQPPATNPCGSCPYRRDVPSGIWHREEYAKLPEYDQATASQPTGVFLCHQQDGRACAGWCGTHDMAHSLAMRFAAHREPLATIDAIMEYKTAVPLFSSGSEACAHGMRDLKTPNHRAQRTVNSLMRKRKGERGL